MADGLEGALAIVFPGQGSQFVGMAQELVGLSPAAERILDEADKTLGIGLSDLMFNGPAETLEDTINAQPAILTASIAALEAVRERMAERGEALHFALTAGHSLGEFSALVAAGVMDFPTTLNLVRERGRFMREAGTERPGGMAAVLGLDDDALRAVCEDASDVGIVVVANANCPGQTVISGEIPALERAMEFAKQRGAKRIARLGVSIASHSPLMASASAQFAELVARAPMNDPAVPVYANITAAPLTSSADVRAELSKQIECPVNWTGSVRAMIDGGASAFLELGPGNVLSGLIKRISRDVRTLSVADLDLGLPAMTAK
jgi:[acyl-carrier-protein] S-malonyltransferase